VGEHIAVYYVSSKNTVTDAMGVDTWNEILVRESVTDKSKLRKDVQSIHTP
jgi:hypothetical protein